MMPASPFVPYFATITTMFYSNYLTALLMWFALFLEIIIAMTIELNKSKYKATNT